MQHLKYTEFESRIQSTKLYITHSAKLLPAFITWLEQGLPYLHVQTIEKVCKVVAVKQPSTALEPHSSQDSDPRKAM